MAVTLKQIAELAGVSTGTVDRALHNRGRVDPNVANRIKKIADELNYHPNIVAQTLAIHRKKLNISIILHVEKPNYFFSQVLQGIHRCMDEYTNYGIAVNILYCTDFCAEEQLANINNAIEQGTSAIIIVPINHSMIRKRLNELHTQNFPVIFLTNMMEDVDYLCYVGCNYYSSGMLSAGLLHTTGNKTGNLLLFSPSFHMYGHVLRAQGLHDRLKKAYPELKLQKIYELSGDEIDDYETTRKALRAYPDTTAFICPGAYSKGNLRALDNMHYLGNRTVICYDYSSWLDDYVKTRKITAIIDQKPIEQGYSALKTAFNLLTLNQHPAEKNHYLETNIIILENLDLIKMK